MPEALHMLARLGRDTVAHHADAGSDVDEYIFGSTTTVDDYRTYLERLYGFIAPYETALAHAPGLEGVLDVRARAKVQLLVSDLLALGLSLNDISQLPVCLAVPSFRGAVGALGWAYVAERPMLASAVIRRHLMTRLPAEMAVASSYLSAYAGHVGSMWRELGMAMEQVAVTTAIADRMIDAALEAFRAQHRWRTHDLPRARLRFAG